MTKLNENLRQNDLKYCISNTISIDEYITIPMVDGHLDTT